MANIVLRNGWNQPATYYNVASVTFQTDQEGVMATFYESGKDPGGGGGGLGAQADWLQNNKDAADYIKNRPFYSYYPEIIAPLTISLVPETYNSKQLYGAVLGTTESLEQEKYVVSWGDKIWLCDVVEVEGKKCLGNTEIITKPTAAQGENIPPFVAIYEDKLITFYAESADSLPAGLFEGEERVIQIDPKYIPEGIIGGLDEEQLKDFLNLNKYITQQYLADNNYITQQYLVNNKYATQTWVQQQNFATQAWVAEELKKIPGIEGFATKEYVDNALKALNNYTTKVYVDGEIKKITDSLSGYATTQWVTNTLKEYVTTTALNTITQNIEKTYATKAELKTLSDSFATHKENYEQYQQEVEENFTNLEKDVTTHQESSSAKFKAIEEDIAAHKEDATKKFSAVDKKFTDTQADWNVEDKTNLAAIKNKPFGIYADLIPNISYSEDSFVRVNNSNGTLVYKLQTGLTLTNTQYEVIWNGNKFICVPDIKTSGAPFLLSMDGSFTTETFPSGRTTITLRLLDNIYRLDKKFLPKDVATEEYVDDKIGEIEQSNWTETNPNSKAYIRNKPTIPAAQVNADWNATSGVARILNKPTIPAAPVNADWNATSGLAFIRNKPTIPDAQVPSDWNEEDSSKVSFIKNKPSIPDPQVNSDWGEEDPAKISFIKNKPNFFSDWNAVDGRTRILNMPTAFRHSVEADNIEEILVDTVSGWKKQTIGRLTMTVTFDDDSVKTYSIMGKEVIE